MAVSLSATSVHCVGTELVLYSPPAFLTLSASAERPSPLFSGGFPDRSDDPFIQALARCCGSDGRCGMIFGIEADIELAGEFPAWLDALFPAHFEINVQ